MINTFMIDQYFHTRSLFSCMINIFMNDQYFHDQNFLTKPHQLSLFFNKIAPHHIKTLGYIYALCILAGLEGK